MSGPLTAACAGRRQGEAESLRRELNEIDEMLDATEGFIYVNDQDRFGKYEEAVNAMVKKVKRVGDYP